MKEEAEIVLLFRPPVFIWQDFDRGGMQPAASICRGYIPIECETSTWWGRPATAAAWMDDGTAWEKAVVETEKISLHLRIEKTHGTATAD